MATSGVGEVLDHRILRLTDMDKEPCKLLAPIEGYEKMPLVSLEEAVEPLISLLPAIQNYAYMAKQKCGEPNDGLTRDESAAITLYSMGWEPINQCLYVVLNTTLRSKDRQKLKPWFLFLKLFLTALSRLPSTRCSAVYRGIKLDLHEHYPQGKTMIWWGFSSCTTSINILERQHIFDKTGPGTLFSIECSSGKDIRKHCYYPSEDEILLLPATYFQIIACVKPSPDLHIFQLKEIQPPFPFLQMPFSISEVFQAARPQMTSIACSSASPKRSTMVVRARGFEVIEMDTNGPKDGSDTKSTK